MARAVRKMPVSPCREVAVLDFPPKTASMDQPSLSDLIAHHSDSVAQVRKAPAELEAKKYDALINSECEAFLKIIRTAPATLGGLVTLLEYALKFEDDLEGGQFGSDRRANCLVFFDTIMRTLRRLQNMRSGGMSTAEIQAAFDAYAELCEAEHEISDRYHEAQGNGADPGLLKKLWAEVMKAEKKGQAAHADLFKIKPATLEALHLKTVLILNIDELAADTVSADIAWLAGIDGGGHEKAT